MARVRIIAAGDALTLHDDSPEPPVELGPDMAIELEEDDHRQPVIPRQREPRFVREPERPEITVQVDDPLRVDPYELERRAKGGEVGVEVETGGGLHVGRLRGLITHAGRRGADITVIARRAPDA